MKQKRLKSQDRRKEILAVALQLAIDNGFDKVSRRSIAKVVGVTGSAIQYHFKTMPKLKRDLMRYAIQKKCLPVIAQGLAVHNVYAKRAPENLRCEALKNLFHII